MANGTIAFDTLTTSDSVNTGTEKSIDTSYFLMQYLSFGFILMVVHQVEQRIKIVLIF